MRRPTTRQEAREYVVEKHAIACDTNASGYTDTLHFMECLSNELDGMAFGGMRLDAAGLEFVRRTAKIIKAEIYRKCLNAICRDTTKNPKTDEDILGPLKKAIEDHKTMAHTSGRLTRRTKFILENAKKEQAFLQEAMGEKEKKEDPSPLDDPMIQAMLAMAEKLEESSSFGKDFSRPCSLCEQLTGAYKAVKVLLESYPETGGRESTAARTTPMEETSREPVNGKVEEKTESK